MIFEMAIFACMGGLLTWLAIPAIRRHHLLRKRHDASQSHHIHKREPSRLGGVALAFPFLTTSVAAWLWFPADAAQTQTGVVIVCSATAMFLLGFWDDLKPLGARKKLAGQILIALFTW